MELKTYWPILTYFFHLAPEFKCFFFVWTYWAFFSSFFLFYSVYHQLHFNLIHVTFIIFIIPSFSFVHFLCICSSMSVFFVLFSAPILYLCNCPTWGDQVFHNFINIPAPFLLERTAVLLFSRSLMSWVGSFKPLTKHWPLPSKLFPRESIILFHINGLYIFLPVKNIRPDTLLRISRSEQ